MKQAIAKLEYHLQSDIKSLQEYKNACDEWNLLFDTEGYTEEELQVIANYEESIASYKQALSILKGV